jgi:hypothetical protein
MHLKLKTTSVVVFFCDKDINWRIGDFQTEKPREIAETEAYSLLSNGIPQIIADSKSGMLLNSNAEIAQALPGIGKMLDDHSVICAAVERGNSQGVRIAWRDRSQPFSSADLSYIQCQGECPDGCD